ncbi:MAG: hypothetical protein HKM02_12750 [Pseudomonadales bacterium]|nr:hypothetical protein [Pseudomonadales bacterium]
MSRCIGWLLSCWVLLVLAGCGSGGGSKLNSQGLTNASVTASCTSLSGVTCISGRFIDDAVANLHYACSDSSGTVQAVTDAGGGFSCPNDSGQVDFYLINNAGTIKVDLGSAAVTQTSDTNGLSTPGYLVVTPRTLAGEDASGSETYSNTSLNITRFLFLFDQVSNAIATISPSNVITLSLPDQEQLATLMPVTAPSSSTATSQASETTVLSSSDFSLDEASFNAKVQTLVAALSRPMGTQAQASTHLDATLNATRAGLYSSPGTALASSSVQTAGFYGSNASEQLFVDPYLMYDRAGRVFGFAITSLLSCGGSCANTSNSSFSTSAELSVFAPGLTPFTVFSKGGQWRDTLTLPGTEGSVNISQGRLYRDHILDTAANYQSTYGASVQVPTADLGQFTLPEQSLSGSYALRRSTLVAPTLDPAIWPSKVVLPLNLLLTFSGSTQIVGQLGIAILPDGNIVTDLNRTCATVDPATLVDAKGVQQYPIGVIANVFSNNGATYLSPVILLPIISALPTALQGVIVGESDITQTLVRLRIDPSSYQYQMYANGLDATTNMPLPDGSSNPAVWMNFYQIRPVLAATTGSTTSAAAAAALATATGTLTSTLENCPP